MRLFLAIELPEPLLESLDAAVSSLRSEAPELAWVVPAKMHLTLRFLGDITADRVESVIAFAEHAARQHRAFAIELGGMGAFPNFRRARVVWIGVAQEPRLELLYHDLELGGADAGFEMEGRPFRPHVTLARVRAPLPEERMRRLGRMARKIDFAATCAVEEITLFESTLAPNGAHYRRVHAAKLAGGGR